MHPFVKAGNCKSTDKTVLPEFSLGAGGAWNTLFLSFSYFQRIYVATNAVKTLTFCSCFYCKEGFNS